MLDSNALRYTELLGTKFWPDIETVGSDCKLVLQKRKFPCCSKTGQARNSASG
jgi:hypothetical protein